MDARPKVAIAGNVRGRGTKIVSVQLNPDLAGVENAALEIPELLPGTYAVNLQVDEVGFWIGNLTPTN